MSLSTGRPVIGHKKTSIEESNSRWQWQVSNMTCDMCHKWQISPRRECHTWMWTNHGDWSISTIILKDYGIPPIYNLPEFSEKIRRNFWQYTCERDYFDNFVVRESLRIEIFLINVVYVVHHKETSPQFAVPFTSEFSVKFSDSFHEKYPTVIALILAKNLGFSWTRKTLNFPENFLTFPAKNLWRVLRPSS